MRTTQPGELVLLISSDHKRFIVRLEAGEAFHTHRGMVAYDDVIGQVPGATVSSHMGARFTVLRPSFDELLMTLPRSSQIVYPKDIGLILLKLSVVPGARVIEAGSGSGVLTTALARFVTPGGHVYSYDARADMIERASQNVQRAGLSDSVTFHQQSIEAGFEQTDIDALFLDVREPWLYLRQATSALTEGGFFGALVPTVNQVVDLVKAAVRHPLADLEVLELLERRYKPVPERVRPLDRLTAHTGFLIFGRRLAEARTAPERDPGIAALDRPEDAEHPESDHGVEDWSENPAVKEWSEDPAVDDWSEGPEADEWSEVPGTSPSESDLGADAR